LVGVTNGLGAVACAGFREDVVDVCFDCRAADDECGGYLGVGEAGGDESEDLEFAILRGWPLRVVGVGAETSG
jgi:hypothetical protein